MHVSEIWECYIKAAHKVVQQTSTSKVLELLHMDLMGPLQIESIAGKRYIFVCVDDFSRFTWVCFIRKKLDTFDSFRNLCIKFKNEKNYNISRIVRIRSDNGRELENSIFSNFYNKYGISHKFSSPKTPEQNNGIERKNRTLQEMARVMLNSKKLSKRLWVEAVNTACHTINRVYFHPGTKKTPYELWKGKKPSVSYFDIFGNICYILNDRKHLEKFDVKRYTSVFLSYSNNSIAYHVFNIKTKTIMELANVVIHDSCDFSKFSKEDAISSLIEEIGDETTTDQPVATPKQDLLPMNLLQQLISQR